jgi:hypothetical protein
MRSAFLSVLGGAVVLAAVSTLGDFIWANWIAAHRPVYGLTHGSLLFLCLGLYLGSLTRRPSTGAVIGTLIGFSAAGSFYLLRPVAGYSIMFVSWVGAWIAVGLLNEYLQRGRMMIGSALVRGVLASLSSGVLFYLVSGIWRPFDPQGWDYVTHFNAWLVAYLPGFASLLIFREHMRR